MTAAVRFPVSESCRSGYLDRSGLEREIAHCHATVGAGAEITGDGDGRVEFFSQGRRQDGRQGKELEAGGERVFGNGVGPGQRAADAATFECQRVERDGFRGHRQCAVDLHRSLDEAVDIRTDEAGRAGFDRCLQRAGLGREVETVAIGVQVDRVDFALRQRRLADIGADIEDGRLGLADQRNAGIVDRQPGLALLPAEGGS